ncbi:G-protein coupled receptor GRL101-like [Tachypleus tridentatus]|uniref:G-protein coupled receptor GRL101-like n=1 Tax=Tachypleus tridentatus TaxID=6853 RepID=UPI003FCF550D
MSVAIGSCAPYEFTCNNSQCIDGRLRCDTFYDCLDRTDEIDCENITCSEGSRKCLGGQCIRLEWWCDFIPDCPDSSDEMFCDEPVRPCAADEFQCSNGQCVPQFNRCFRSNKPREGCADGSHLIGCDNSTCATGQLKCINSYCIDGSLVCDGDIHCQFSWTDEIGCPFQCSEEERCPCIDVTINCTDVGLTLFPKNIEHQMSRFLFRGNNLSGSLQKGVFHGMEKAGLLDLGRNQITSLTPRLFQNLWRLKILYLDDNLLTSLLTNTFLGLGQLRSL